MGFIGSLLAGGPAHSNPAADPSLASATPVVDITQPWPSPPVVQGIAIPPPRSKAQVDAVLSAVPALSESEKTRSFHLVLCAAKKDPGHGGVGYHDYPVWRERWTRILGGVPGVTVEPADQWPTPEQWAKADVIAFFHDNPVWDASKGPELDAFLARGGGVVFLHFALNGRREPKALAERIGRAWTGNQWLRGDVALSYRAHEVTRGFPESNVHPEEPYWKLFGEGEGTTTVASLDVDGAAQPQVWCAEKGGGRVFVYIPCHFTWTHDDPLFRVLVYRGMAWVGRRPVNRLDAGVFTGARFALP
ncbi:MAG: hypothetical protein RLZZ244_2494 [Verrucomicrobiota bacterium]|jgi:hypothetical protein